MSSINNQLETTLKRKTNMPLSEVSKKTNLPKFELQLCFLKLLLTKIKNYNFRTPSEKHKYLKNVFPYLQSKDNSFSEDQKAELIENLVRIKFAIFNKLNLIKTKHSDFNDEINEDILNQLLNEINYTILLVYCDYDYNKMKSKIKNTYSFLDYVTFEEKDLNIFACIFESTDDLDYEKIKKYFDQIRHKYLSSLLNSDCDDQEYYGFLIRYLTTNKHINEIDSKLQYQKIKEFINNNYDHLQVNSLTELVDFVALSFDIDKENIKADFPFLDDFDTIVNEVFNLKIGTNYS